MTTTIEWTEETWNPTTGCDRVSPGCDNCYALKMAGRLKAMGQAKYQRDGDPRTSGPGFGLTVHPDALDLPSRVKKPTTFFVNSMSDLFHPEVPAEFILNVWETMSRCRRHTFQILTKRPQRMAKLVDSLAWNWDGDEHGGEPFIWPGPSSGVDCTGEDFEWFPTEEDADGGGEQPLPNVWLGTSIESDRYTFRADHLRATPSAVRFLSLEPLLGPLPSLDLTGIDWVIVGGESGPGARPMHPDWVRDIRDCCVTAGVPFFFKQWGEYGPEGPEDRLVIVADDGTVYRRGELDWPDGPRRGEAIRSGHNHANLTALYRVGKKVAGRELDGRTWDEMPGRSD